MGSVPTRVAEPPRFDALIYIGRFQPFHDGHLQVVRSALAQGRVLVILLGSAGLPRSTRNPWSAAERGEMVLASLSDAERPRVSLQPLEDTLYDDAAWLAGVRRAATAGLAALNASGRVGLIGHDKDQSSYYLQLFPEWESVPVDHFDGIDATPIREALLRGEPMSGPVPVAGYRGERPVASLLPAGVRDFLDAFARSDAAAVLREEQRYVDRWRADWSVAPYPPVFVTVDALVTCQEHLLLIERGRHPGRGLWALPGGFIDPGELIRDACIRELGEETCLLDRVPRGELLAGLGRVRVFDEPNRSARGRTITHVHHFSLSREALPDVRAADDASRAFWLPLEQLAPARLFEDHYFIVRAMLATA